MKKAHLGELFLFQQALLAPGLQRQATKPSSIA
jgi:hypothetical protein